MQTQSFKVCISSIQQSNIGEYRENISQILKIAFVFTLEAGSQI